jgi:catechol 2,3-dioxygenase-like lactoylglutathione lyase family enzyme
MAVELNHTIVQVRNREESAEFLAHILGLQVGNLWGPFLPVVTANGVTLDFATADAEPITAQHYAFLLSEEEFDGCFERIRAAGVTFYPGPDLSHPGVINHNDGGRGLYFLDPSGHGMEIFTRPYGSGGN